MSSSREAEPLQGTQISAAARDALALAAARGHGGPISSFGLLQALIVSESTGAWTRVQLRTTHIEQARVDIWADPAAAATGVWETTPLTETCRLALARAERISRVFDLRPLPVGVIALGLLSDPYSGAARALLSHSEIGHAGLLELVQHEILGVGLEGLMAVVARHEPPAPAAAPAVERPTDPAKGPFHATAPLPARRDAGKTPARPAGQPAGPRVPVPTFDTMPRLSEPRRRRLEGAVLLVERERDEDPWILATGESVFTIHDLDTCAAAERHLPRLRAELQRAAGQVLGVLPVIAVGDDGNYLVVETPRFGESLRDHLDERQLGRVGRPPAETYAEVVSRVAMSLKGLHDLGMVHGDLSPLDLVASPESGWLLVRGVSDAQLVLEDLQARLVGKSGRQSRVRYLAPEVYEGEVGPLADQFALGAIANELFTGSGAPPVTMPVEQVLRRATDKDPRARFETVSDFGLALARAVRQEAPRSVFDRVRALRPSYRAAFGPTVVLALASVVGVALGVRHDLTDPLSALLLGLLAAVVFGGWTWLVLALGTAVGRRLHLGLAIARHSALWFALAVATGLVVVTRGGEGLSALFYIPVVYAVRAVLGAPATRPERALDLLDRITRRVGTKPSGRRALGVATCGLLAVILASPGITASLWQDPPTFPSSTARSYGPLIAVWNLRSALGQGHLVDACSSDLSLAAADTHASCQDIAEVAAAVQGADPITRSAVPTAGERGTIDTYRVSERPAPSGTRFWQISAPSGVGYAGVMYTDGPAENNKIEVMLFRTLPVKSLTTIPTSTWLYDVTIVQKDWYVTAYRACTVPPPGSGTAPAKCIVSTSASSAYIRQALAIVHKHHR